MEKMTLRQFIIMHAIAERPMSKEMGITEEEFMGKMSAGFTPDDVKKIEKAFRNVYGITYKSRKGERFYEV